MPQMCAEGTPVHHATSILIPSEEVVFSLYEASSTIAVLQLNERASIPVRRIVDAIPVKELRRRLVSVAPSRHAAVATRRLPLCADAVGQLAESWGNLWQRKIGPNASIAEVDPYRRGTVRMVDV
jgi:hypothetical protein